MSSDSMASAAGELRWRIPTTGDPIQLRLALAQVGLATIAGALLILVALPASWKAPALIGLMPLASFVAYRRWSRYQQSVAGPENVRLDAAGLHWLNAAGDEQSFPRETVVAFRIGREEDTLRP